VLALDLALALALALAPALVRVLFPLFGLFCLGFSFTLCLFLSVLSASVPLNHFETMTLPRTFCSSPSLSVSQSLARSRY